MDPRSSIAVVTDAPAHGAADAPVPTQVRVVIAGAPAAVEPLTYAIPPALSGRVAPGQRVLVPMRSRRVTGLVIETAAQLDAAGAKLRPLLELLDARPLFDRAHLELIDFLASYYMVPLGEAYRSVLPAASRVESSRTFRLGAPPTPLMLAALAPLERAILEALTRRPSSLRQLGRLGEAKTLTAALARLEADGLVERGDATRGRHRATVAPFVRLAADAAASTMRGRAQRAIVALMREHPAGLSQDRIEAEIPGARTAIRTLVARGILQLAQHDPINAANGRSEAQSLPDGDLASPAFDLSWEQSAAIDAVLPALRSNRFESFLLWGVTASGKTEVYLRLAAEVLDSGRQALVLVPEIALADQIVRAFRARFGARVAIVHSAQNIADRWGSWMAALSGDARIMIGPRSAVFAPLHEIGLIVVDEEHDPAYKQEDGIRYHARDLAVALGRFSRCPVVLGSATPSAESFANARRGRYKLLRLSHRVAERDFAAVELIDLREHRGAPAAQPSAASDGARDVVPLSPPLVAALRENLAAGGQSVVFLNRRGYHNFLQCHLCGNVIACSNCSVSLTFHLRDRSLRCHYCGANANAPEACPACSGFGLEGQGFGTERLTQTLAELLPTARIERMDSDTSSRRGARTALMDALRAGTLDILVGTQMVTKGFDLPGVTLVGVVMADIALNLPDFRSAERTFQLLTQVAGRAGRGERPGRVLIQTYAPHHYSIRAARDQDFARFMRRELELRRELMYPPFARMALVRVEGPHSAAVAELAGAVAAHLARAARPDAMRVLGPAPAPIERIRNRYRWQVVLKAMDLNEMRAALSAMRSALATRAEPEKIHLMLDIDPVNML